MKRHHIWSKLVWKLLLIKFHLQRRKNNVRTTKICTSFTTIPHMVSCKWWRCETTWIYHIFSNTQNLPCGELRCGKSCVSFCELTIFSPLLTTRQMASLWQKLWSFYGLSIFEEENSTKIIWILKNYDKTFNFEPKE